MQAIINLGGNVYEYEGWRFEVHLHCGPHPLKKNGDPRASIPESFWPAYKAWFELSNQEKAETLVSRGGCVHV